MAFFAGKQMQVKSRVVLFSWHVNKKLKTKLNDFLKNGFKHRKNSGRVHSDEEMTPQEPNKCLQMFYLSARKRDGRAARHLCAKLVVFASDK